MDFWNTVLGNHLAETLIRCLPEITEKKQNTVIVENKKAPELVISKISQGESYVASMPNSDDSTLLIFEK